MPTLLLAFKKRCAWKMARSTSIGCQSRACRNQWLIFLLVLRPFSDLSTEGKEMTDPTSIEPSAMAPDSTIEIERLAQRGKTFYQERAAALRTELAQVEEELRRFE